MPYLTAAYEMPTLRYRSLSYQGQTITMTKSEARIMRTLLTANDFVDRQTLFGVLHPDQWIPGNESELTIVRIHMQHIREKLSGMSIRIEAHPGFGYRAVLN